MNVYKGVVSILYHQDPVTGYEAYSLYPVDLQASLILNDLGKWSIAFNFPFDHSREGETIELGINHAYSSNPKIFIDLGHWPKDTSDLPSRFEVTFFEAKADWEAPWTRPRRFELNFLRL